MLLQELIATLGKLPEMIGALDNESQVGGLKQVKHSEPQCGYQERNENDTFSFHIRDFTPAVLTVEICLAPLCLPRVSPKRR